jgi:AcrR family transcriptional regulator
VPPSFNEYRLPRGRHGLPRELVNANQRWRLLGACAEVLAEQGYSGATVSNVTAGAAVSKATFYRNFDGLPSCILATFELAVENALAVIGQGCEREAGTEPHLARSLSPVLDFLEAEPALAAVLTDGALNDVPGLAAARAEFAERCSSLLVSARGERRSGKSERRARHLIRGLQGWLSMRLAAGEAVDHPKDLARLLTV